MLSSTGGNPYVAPIVIAHAVIAVMGLGVLLPIAVGHPLNSHLSSGILAVLLVLRFCVERGYRVYIRKDGSASPSSALKR